MIHYIKRTKPALPVRWLCDNGLIKGSVLHHGRGQDIPGSELIAAVADVLREYDPQHEDISSRSVLKHRHDTVISAFVLNILPPHEREKAIFDIASTTSKAGAAYIAVRGQGKSSGFYKAKARWKKQYDGLASGRRFQKYYTQKQLLDDLKKVFPSVDIINGSDKSSFIIAEAKHMKINLPKRSKKYGVGKNMGNSGVYIHRKYEAVFEHVPIFKKHLPKTFNYTVVKYNPKNNSFTFICSPDFDTSHEPIVANAILVRSDGSIKKMAQHKDPWIYHHKWLMVRDGYEGFDVENSKARSETWLSIPGINKSKIGKKSHWETHIIPLINRARQ